MSRFVAATAAADEAERTRQQAHQARSRAADAVAEQLAGK